MERRERGANCDHHYVHGSAHSIERYSPIPIPHLSISHHSFEFNRDYRLISGALFG